MPEPTLDAVADHGVVKGDTIRGTYEDSREVLDRLADAGVEYDDVVRELKDAGVAAFEDAWTQLLTDTRAALVSAEGPGR